MDTANSLVIVALPDENDPVRQYSSEKEPHLTLLYLDGTGLDASDLEHIAEYVGHAASMLPRFSLDVESRGALGDQNADVLFFSKRWAQNIATFRGQLLKDDLINKAYLSADQYPEWTPHLTMGYPTSPAKKDTREYPGFSYVSFDRIAFWTGDYTGPTFQLKPYDLEVSMEQTAIRNNVTQGMIDSLAHFGVKGMKWGVRRSASELASNKPPASEDVLRVDAHRNTVKAGGTRALSNKELRELVDRMNLEQQYSDLKAKNKSTIDKGHSEVKRILSLGDTASKAYNLYKSPAGKALRKALTGV